MSTELATVNHQMARAVDFSKEQQSLIRDMYGGGASEAEFNVFLEICRARNLNPFLRQIYFVSRYDSQKSKNVWAAQVAIDGMRAQAERTGLYEGQDEPAFEYDEKGRLLLARVKVYRKGWTRPSVGVARWSEYVQTKRDGSPTRFWETMPHNQLAKCAESLALRKAFPEELSGLYTSEEMGQSENPEPPARREPQKRETRKVTAVVEAPVAHDSDGVVAPQGEEAADDLRRAEADPEEVPEWMGEDSATQEAAEKLRSVDRAKRELSLCAQTEMQVKRCESRRAVEKAYREAFALNLAPECIKAIADICAARCKEIEASWPLGKPAGEVVDELGGRM